MYYEDYEGRDLQGTVLRLERSSIYDGDGFRTVVFLKGCPLRCWWCSTPESQKFNIEEGEGKIYGRVMTVEEVLREVRKDIPFYFHSGGGMTISGGEMLAQPEFSRCLIRRAAWEGISTAVETTLMAQWEHAEPVLRSAEIAFVDLKFITEEKHKKYCGVNNRLILENIRKADEIAGGFRLILRMPLIPGINDTEEELTKIGEFCSSLRNVHHLELLPYHRLGTDTYRKLGRPYKLPDVEAPSAEHMDRCRDFLKQYLDTVSW